MNYRTGKLIVIASFLFNILISLLFILGINLHQWKFISNCVSTLQGVFPAVVALGFSVMYSCGKNKYNLAIAIASALSFLATYLSLVVPPLFTYTLIYSTIVACISAIFPLAFAMKCRRRFPIFAVIFVISAVQIVATPMIYELPLFKNDMGSIFNTIFILNAALSLLVSALYILTVALDKE